MDKKFQHHGEEMKIMDTAPFQKTPVMTGLMKMNVVKFVDTNYYRKITGGVLPDQSKITETDSALKSNDVLEEPKMRIINFGREYFLTNDCFDYSLSKLYCSNVKNGTNISSFKNNDHKQLAHFYFFSAPVCDYQNRLMKKSGGFAEKMKFNKTIKEFQTIRYRKIRIQNIKINNCLFKNQSL